MPSGAQPHSRNQKHGMSKGQKVGLIGGALAAFGAFLPWFKISILATSLTVRGIDKDGVFTLIAAIVAVLIIYLYWSNSGKLLAGLMGLFIAGVGFVYITNPLAGVQTSAFQRALLKGAIQIGSGLYLTLIGGIGILIASVYNYLNAPEKRPIEELDPANR